MTLSSRLVKAAKFLTDDRWCRRSYALDKEGRECFPSNKNAVKFCLMGVLSRFNLDRAHNEVHAVICEEVSLEKPRTPKSRLSFPSISIWNDDKGRGARDVRRVLMLAARRLRNKGK